MRYLIIIAVILMFCNRTACSETSYFLLTLDNSINDRIFFTLPSKDGSYFSGKFIQIKPDENNTITIKLELYSPGFIYFSLGLDRNYQIYIVPRASVKVRISNEKINFYGNLKDENALLYKLGMNDIPHAIGFQDLTIERWRRTEVGINIIDSIEVEVNRKLALLLKYNSFSDEFVGHIETMLKCYYRIKAVSLLEEKFYDYMYRNDVLVDSIDSGSEAKVFSDIFYDSIHLDHLLTKSKWGYEYLNDYIFRYKVFFKKEGLEQLNRFENLKKLINYNYFLGAVPLVVDKYLIDNRIKEFYLANYMMMYLFAGEFYKGEELLSMYTSFENVFPHSECLLFLKARISSK